VKRISLAVGLLSCSLLSLPLFGHHSFAAEYDRNKQFELKGTVTKVEWMNPHAYFYLDVKDESSGKVVNWAFELGNLSTLMRQGWRKDSLKPGDIVTVQAVGGLALSASAGEMYAAGSAFFNIGLGTFSGSEVTVASSGALQVVSESSLAFGAARLSLSTPATSSGANIETLAGGSTVFGSTLIYTEATGDRGDIEIKCADCRSRIAGGTTLEFRAFEGNIAFSVTGAGRGVYFQPTRTTFAAGGNTYFRGDLSSSVQSSSFTVDAYNLDVTSATQATFNAGFQYNGTIGQSVAINAEDTISVNLQNTRIVDPVGIRVNAHHVPGGNPNSLHMLSKRIDITTNDGFLIPFSNTVIVPLSACPTKRQLLYSAGANYGHDRSLLCVCDPDLRWACVRFRLPRFPTSQDALSHT